MTRKRQCYSFEPSGHRYLALDGFLAEGGSLVTRLYCPSCGRVIPATTDNNTADWNLAALPIESQNDFMTNAPNIIRKTDA